MKPELFYKNEKEKQELIAQRDSFAFSVPDEHPKLLVLLAGKEGSGKTHLACTMNELGPVYLLDTEYRAQIVTKKFSNVKFALVKNFLGLLVAVKHIVKSQPPGTIIMDSGSDLQTFAEIQYLERTEKEKVGMPWNWAEVWRLCNAIIDEIKFSQKFNLVVTARLKEEYMNDKATGQMVPRIYQTLPYKADVILQFTSDRERKLVLTKNGFTGNTAVLIKANESLPSILRQLSDSHPAVTQVVNSGVPMRKAS